MVNSTFKREKAASASSVHANDQSVEVSTISGAATLLSSRMKRRQKLAKPRDLCSSFWVVGVGYYMTALILVGSGDKFPCSTMKPRNGIEET